MQRRYIAIFDIRGLNHTTAMYPDRYESQFSEKIRDGRNRIYIGARRRKACQLSNGLNGNLQRSKANAVQKMSSPGYSWSLVKVLIFGDDRWLWHGWEPMEGVGKRSPAAPKFASRRY